MQLTLPLRTLTTLIISRPAALLFSTRPQPTSYDFSCLGWDGRPLRGGEVETEENRECYENRKPSPPSKVEFVDKRKHVDRATEQAGDEKELLLVRETVDDALRRAEAMWWEAKVRGDPDSPQARALAKMLRERYNEEENEASIA